MQSVLRVDPSICGVRFFNKSQVGWSKLLELEADPFWPEDQPLEDPEEVVVGQLEPLLERPGGLLRPDLPHKS